MNIGIIVTSAALIVLVAFLLSHIMTLSRAVRARNALLVEPSGSSDFTWNPPGYPVGFKVERLPADRVYRDVVDSLHINSNIGDWHAALAIATHLVESAQDKGPVHANPLKTYRAILDGYGYCADFVKVFLVLANAAGLVARRWAFSFDGFGGHGHTVVEVYDRQRGRWLMVDVYNNFHAVDAETGEPLGVLEYRDALLGRRGAAVMRPNGPGRLGFVHPHIAVDYYRRGIHQWYLQWGNAVLSGYSHPVVRMMGRFSLVLEHLAANVFGLSPRIHIYETPENATEVRNIFRLRRALRLTIGAVVVLLIILGVQLGFARIGNSGKLASTSVALAYGEASRNMSIVGMAELSSDWLGWRADMISTTVSFRARRG